MAKSTGKVFPKVHFYDQELVDLYNKTWNWIKNSWKSGTEENGFSTKYFNHPENDTINQFETCF